MKNPPDDFFSSFLPSRFSTPTKNTFFFSQSNWHQLSPQQIKHCNFRVRQLNGHKRGQAKVRHGRVWERKTMTCLMIFFSVCLFKKKWKFFNDFPHERVISLFRLDSETYHGRFLQSDCETSFLLSISLEECHLSLHAKYREVRKTRDIWQIFFLSSFVWWEMSKLECHYRWLSAAQTPLMIR